MLGSAKRSSRSACRSAGLLIGFLVGGCVAIPWPTPHPAPYVVDGNVELASGTTRLESVIANLGEPSATYCDRLEAVYTAFQQTAVLVVGGLVPAGPIPIPVGTIVKLGREHVLNLRFDEIGVLQDYDLQIAKAERWLSDSNCTRDGVCTYDDNLFRYAAAEVDAHSKRFETVPGGCVVYFFYGPTAHYGLRIDGKDAAAIVLPHTFVWVTVQPGDHSFTVTVAQSPRWMRPGRREEFRAAWGPDETLPIVCKPGELLFIGPADGDENRPQHPSPAVIDAAAGQRAIAGRKLIMAKDPWSAASCGNTPKSRIGLQGSGPQAEARPPAGMGR